MIAASEPLEFVPHGRTVLARHPGQIYSKHNTSASENSLLYKLTNFAIKDESLLEARDAEEQEWWCIREVYYRSTDDFEDEPQPKDSKYEYNSESFRAPSRLKHDFNISIKSELISGMKKMDAEGLNSAGPSRGGSANSSSNMSKKFNLTSGPSRSNKAAINPKTDCSYEEELYVKGCTAVWSKGLISTPATKLSDPEHRETIACYTIENPIKHAAFCNFHIDIKNTMLIDALNTQIGDVKKNIKIEDTTEHIQTKIMPAILLIDNKCMKVYANEGREYITSIPFQVKKVWPMKYGVLLEKEATPLTQNSILPNSFLKFNDSQNSTFSKSKSNYPFNMSSKLRADSCVSGFEQDVSLPTCFSLTHPLDEVTPILMKSPSQGLQYYNDGDMQIFFVSSNPSIILLYDWKLGTHSLWRIRKTLRDECLSMCPNMNSTTTVFSQSCDFVGSPMQSQRNVTSWATGLGSPYQSKKMPGTPTMSRSRINSPMANVFHQQGLSPHASIGQASYTSMMANNGPQNPPSLPLYPDICLDHIWTDTQTIRRDPIESASDMKTFLHTDLVGHDYLCFIVKVGGVSRLQIVRLQRSHSLGQTSKTNLMVGAVSTVLAKDAVVLEHLNMIALIDEAGNIILQSGNHVVGKVHVGGVLARLIDSPYTKRATFQSPFPRRSSLLPSRCNEASFDDSALHLLSPVPHTSAARLEQKESLGLCGLCDAAGSRLTLQFETGSMYRISLPPLTCSTLVTRCYTALRAILPKDVTMQVIIKWYGVRNAPGTQDLTPEQEWSMFSNLLLSLIGYDVERLNTKQNDDAEPEVATKKQRASSDGSPDDWNYLLNSKMHKAIGHSLTMLKLPIPNSDGYRKGKRTSIEPEKTSSFNTNSVLFPYVLQVLYSLHLVYEEIKLNTLLWSNLRPLSNFLYQISKDLKLDAYVNHYWLDFPTDLNLEYEEESQINEGSLKKLSEPVYFSREPPNVYSYLNSMLKDLDVGYYPYLADVNNMSRDIIEILAIVGCGRSAGVQTISHRDTVTASSTPRARRDYSSHASPYCHAVITACDKGITLRDIDNLPPAIGLLLLTIFSRCKSSPPADWPPAAYNLVMREDLAHQAEVAHTMKTASDYMEFIALEVLEKDTVYTLASRPVERVRSNPEDADVITGMEHLNTQLLSLLYPRDHRMTEVINLLQSSIPVNINLTQRPEVSDHDFIEEQEKYLYAISTRTMALPIARGMASLRTVPCGATEAVEVPRVCVWGRWRGRGAAHAPPLTHGGQMAVHCTIGLLFLGGGRATLSTSATSVAALLAAFFPKFPTHSEDNRYHLQAFRHLYVLAVEARLILPRDISTEKLCYAHIQVIDLNNVVKEMKAPCIIPELDTLKEVKINDPRYWPITFQRDRNWDQLKLFLEYSWCIDIKQRAGCLSYLADPQGFLTILAQTLTLDKANIWSTNTDNIELFTNDDKVQNFVKQYLFKDVGTNVCADCLVVGKKKKKDVVFNSQCQCRQYTKEEREHLQTLGMVTYECVVKDILCALPIWTTFLKIIKTMKPDPSSYHIWQIKLLLSQIESHNKRTMNEMKIDGQESTNEPLISSEFTLAIKQKVSNIFDSWESRLTPFLRKYLGLPSSRKISACDDDVKKILSGFLVYHDLPKGALKEALGDEALSVLLQLDSVPVEGSRWVLQLLS